MYIDNFSWDKTAKVKKYGSLQRAGWPKNGNVLVKCHIDISGLSAHPKIEGNKQENLSRQDDSILQHVIMKLALNFGPMYISHRARLESGTRSKASRQWSICYVCMVCIYLYCHTESRARERFRVLSENICSLQPALRRWRSVKSYGWIRKMRRKQLQPAPAVTERSTFASRMQIWLFWCERRLKQWNANAQNLNEKCDEVVGSEDEMLHLQSD